MLWLGSLQGEGRVSWCGKHDGYEDGVALDGTVAVEHGQPLSCCGIIETDA